MQKDLERVIDSLTSGSYAQTVSGLTELEQLLSTLVPSVRKYHQSGVQDAPLSAFVALQDNFQYNVATAFAQAYGTFLAERGTADQAHILLANHLLCGILLIHGASRNVFGRRASMNTILQYLDPTCPLYHANTSSSFVSLILHILLKNLRNMRTFEACNGCQLMIRHLAMLPDQAGEQQQTLHFKVVEFLIFYLADEHELSKLPENAGVDVLSVGQKADLFRPAYPGIDHLVESLNDLTSLRGS